MFLLSSALSSVAVGSTSNYGSAAKPSSSSSRRKPSQPPCSHGLFTFVSLAVTSSTETIFGRAISSPIHLLGAIGGLLTIFLAIFSINCATITTNIATNIVALANALINLNPSPFMFRRGALLTTLLGIVYKLWRLLKSSQSFVYTWLMGYSALLGPIGAIVIVDYYILRRTALDVDDLYSDSPQGAYYYTRGFNLTAMAALVIGILPVVPGFLNKVGMLKTAGQAFVVIYNNSWFISFFIAGIIYWSLSCLKGERGTSQSVVGVAK